MNGNADLHDLHDLIFFNQVNHVNHVPQGDRKRNKSALPLTAKKSVRRRKERLC